MFTRFVLIGLTNWAVAILGLRLAGQFFFHPGEPAILLVAIFLLTAIVLSALLSVLTAKVAHERATAVIAIVLPNILLDTFTVLFFPHFFPNMDPSVTTLFAAWLIWGYAFALLGTFLSLNRNA